MKGDTGLQGIQGIPGVQGDQGLQGIQGVPGQDGLTTSVNGVAQVGGAILLTPDDFTDGVVNKVYSATEKSKLAGVATGATKTIVANNLTETVAGKALDAVQGKELASQMADSTKYLPNAGTANALVVNKNGFILTDGAYFEVKTTADNTGAVTANVSGLGVKSCRNEKGIEFASGKLKAGYHKFIYDGTNDFFRSSP